MKKILIFLFLLVSISLSAANKRFTVVIDAGHGGHDAGACGAFSKEKDLTLKYALALGNAIERDCPDVKVVYTRKTDVFLELWQRAEIANKQKADLFISVHINSLPAGRLARGYQTYTLGKGESGVGIQKNLEVAKRENSVILMEKNYQQNYQGFDPNSAESNIMFEFIQDTNMEHSVDLAKMMQRNVCAATGRKDMGAHQANLAVLRLTSMPGALLELGFISTPDEEQFLNSDDALKKYVTGIYNAFVAYRNKYDNSIVVPYKAKTVPSSNVPNIVPDEYKKQETGTKKQETTTKKQETTPQKPAETTVKPEATTVKPTEQKTVNESLPVFKVQILASSRKLAKGDASLKGHADAICYEDGNMFKYTLGNSNDYNEILALRRQLLNDFPQAFIIAFKEGKRIDVNEAIREFKAQKK